MIAHIIKGQYRKINFSQATIIKSRLRSMFSCSLLNSTLMIQPHTVMCERSVFVRRTVILFTYLFLCLFRYFRERITGFLLFEFFFLSLWPFL